MSESTQDLLDLVSELGRRRLRSPQLHLSVIAYNLITGVRDPDKFDRIAASIKLNKALFLREAETPERRILHEAIIAAVNNVQKERSEKGGRHGSSRAKR